MRVRAYGEMALLELFGGIEAVLIVLLMLYPGKIHYVATIVWSAVAVLWFFNAYLSWRLRAGE